jgi:hypothetical protein
MLALAAGCAKEEPTAPAPPPVLGPPIETVFPAARSAGVFYDTDIWVRFLEPLDPATINERTVFLKLDTVRNPVALSYDVATRTIRLTPQVTLALLRTYTVELTRGVETAAGQPLAQTYFWQFTTNGLRRLENPFPESGATGASPFGMLRWGGTEPTAGTIRYEVFVGPDSGLIAARGVPALGAVTEAAYLPRVSWGTGGRLYWAINSTNQTNGEHLAGPVWRFETLPAETPVDSVTVPMADWAYYREPQRQLVCNGPSIVSFPTSNNGIHWQFDPGPGDLVLAGARLHMSVVGTGVNFNLAPYQPVFIQGLGDPWLPCVVEPIFPRADSRGALAGGTQIGTTSRVRFEGDAFTAHLEAAVRFGYGYGYRLWTNVSLSVASPNANTSPLTDPVLTLYYYRASAPAGRPAP